MLQIVASLSDNSRGFIYDHNIFIIQATVKCHGENISKGATIIALFYPAQGARASTPSVTSTLTFSNTKTCLYKEA